VPSGESGFGVEAGVFRGRFFGLVHGKHATVRQPGDERGVGREIRA